MKLQIVLIPLVLISLVGCKTEQQLRQQLATAQTQAQNSSKQVDELQKQKADLDSKLKTFGSVSVSTSPTSSEDQKGKEIFQSKNWYKENNPDIYKNEIIGGLGRIWVKVDSGWYEGGSVDLKRYAMTTDLVDKGTTIFSHYCNSKFNTDIDAFKQVKGQIGTNSYARLIYEIVGTSKLDYDNDSLLKIASKYFPMFENKNIKGIFICTGYHVKHLGCTVYDSVGVGASVTTPVINVNGGFFTDDKSEVNSWEVYRQLFDLSIFFHPVKKDSVTRNVLASLPKNQSVYQTLQSSTKSNLSDSDLIAIINDPAILQGKGLDQFLNDRNIVINDAQKKKVESIGAYLNSIKKSTDVQPVPPK